MSKYLLLLAVCLLGAVFVFAQASQDSQAPAQQSSSQSQQAQPQQPDNGSGNAVRGDRNDAGASPAAPGTNDTSQTTQPAGDANRSGGIGWGWLIVAVIVGVVIISLLSRGRTERAPALDHTADDERARERDRDDIRRAG